MEKISLCAMSVTAMFTLALCTAGCFEESREIAGSTRMMSSSLARENAADRSVPAPLKQGYGTDSTGVCLTPDNVSGKVYYAGIMIGPPLSGYSLGPIIGQVVDPGNVTSLVTSQLLSFDMAKQLTLDGTIICCGGAPYPSDEEAYVRSVEILFGYVDTTFTLTAADTQPSFAGTHTIRTAYADVDDIGLYRGDLLYRDPDDGKFKWCTEDEGCVFTSRPDDPIMYEDIADFSGTPNGLGNQNIPSFIAELAPGHPAVLLPKGDILANTWLFVLDFDMTDAVHFKTDITGLQSLQDMVAAFRLGSDNGTSSPSFTINFSAISTGSATTTIADNDTDSTTTTTTGIETSTTTSAIPDTTTTTAAQSSTTTTSAPESTDTDNDTEICAEDTGFYGGAQGYPKAQSFIATTETINGAELYMKNPASSSWSLRLLSALPAATGYHGAYDTADLDNKTLASATVSKSDAGWVEVWFDSAVPVSIGQTYFLFVDNCTGVFGESVSTGNWYGSEPGPHPGPYENGTGWILVYEWSDNGNNVETLEAHQDYAFCILTDYPDCSNEYDSYGGSQIYPKAQSFVANDPVVGGAEMYIQYASVSPWEVRVLSALPAATGERAVYDQDELDANTLASGYGQSDGAGWVQVLFSEPARLTVGTQYFLFMDGCESCFGEQVHLGNWYGSEPGPFPGPYPFGTGWILVYEWSDNFNNVQTLETHQDYAFCMLAGAYTCADDYTASGGAARYPKAQSFIAQDDHIARVKLYIDNPAADGWSVRILSDLPNAAETPGVYDYDDLESKTLGSAAVQDSEAGWVELHFSQPVSVTTDEKYYLFMDGYPELFGSNDSDISWRGSEPGSMDSGPYHDGTAWILVNGWSDNGNYTDTVEHHQDFAFCVLSE